MPDFFIDHSNYNPGEFDQSPVNIQPQNCYIQTEVIKSSQLANPEQYLIRKSDCFYHKIK